MQSSSNELSTLVSGKVQNVNKRTLLLLCYIIPYISLADVVRLLAERSDTKSNVKLGRFRSQL